MRFGNPLVRAAVFSSALLFCSSALSAMVGDPSIEVAQDSKEAEEGYIIVNGERVKAEAAPEPTSTPKTVCTVTRVTGSNMSRKVCRKVSDDDEKEGMDRLRELREEREALLNSQTGGRID